MAAHQADLAAFARFDGAVAIPFRQQPAVGEKAPDPFRRRIPGADKAHRTFGNHLTFFLTFHVASFFKAASSASRRGFQKAWMRATQSETSLTPSGSRL